MYVISGPRVELSVACEGPEREGLMRKLYKQDGDDKMNDGRMSDGWMSDDWMPGSRARWVAAAIRDGGDRHLHAEHSVPLYRLLYPYNDAQHVGK